MLQHELWIERLAERAELHADTGYALWRAYVAYVRHRLQVSLPAYLPSVGLCLVEQSEAYVAELPSSERYIVPPCLVLHVQRHEVQGEASERELLSLSDALALECELGDGLLVVWLRSIEPLLMEWLQQGQTVYWEGLGELTPVLNDAGGLEAFSWSLSLELSQAINKPFEVFRPVPLRNESLLEQGLELREIVSLEVLNAPQVVTIRLAPEEVLPEQMDMPDVQETEHEACASDPIAPAGIEEEATPPIVEVIPVQEERETIAEGERYPTEMNSAEPRAEVEIPQQAEACAEMPQPKKGKGRWWLILLLVLLLGTVLYLIYNTYRDALQSADGAEPSKVRELVQAQSDTLSSQAHAMQRDTLPMRAEDQTDVSPTPTAVVPEPIIDPPVSDTLAQSPKESKAKVQGQTKTERLADQQEVVVLASGQSLRTLAQRKYGDSVFWVYIYEENRELIPNPNQVAVGTKLILPPARKYGIDAKDAKARDRALILQRSYSSAP